MRDADVRQVLRSEINDAHRADPDTRIIEELALEHGTSRIDIAVINGEIHGFEIKSERDTLDRLPKQIELYGLVMDRVTLVVGKRHLDHAKLVIPAWWGIKIAETINGGVFLSPEREGKVNPAPDPFTIAMLLWKDEALAELVARNADKGVRSKPRTAMYERLTQILDLNELRYVVRTRLKNRASWRSAEQSMLCGG